MTEINLLPDEQETDLLSSTELPKVFTSETSDILSILSRATQNTFDKKQPAPVIVDSQTEAEARTRFSLLETVEKGGIIDELVVQKILAQAPPEEIDELLSLSLVSDPSSVLERRAAQYLSELGMHNDEKQAATILDEFSPEGRRNSRPSDRRQDFIATMLRLNTSRHKVLEKLEGATRTDKAADMVTIMLLPFHTSVVNAKVFGRELERLGTSVRGFSEDFWNAPLDERMRIMDEFDTALANNTVVSENLFSALVQVEQMQATTSFEAWLLDAIEVLDATIVGMPLAKLLLWLKNISRFGRIAGAKDLTAGRAVALRAQEKQARAERPASEFGQTIEGEFIDITPGSSKVKALTILEEEELIENILPSSAIAHKGPEKITGPTNQALETVTTLDEMQKLLPQFKQQLEKAGVKVEDFDLPDLVALIQDTPFPEVLNAAGRAAAVEDAKAAILSTLGVSERARSMVDPARYNGAGNSNYAYFDVDIDNVSGIQTVHMYFGTGSDMSKGYVNEAAAIKGAARMGLEVGFYRVSERSGEFFVQVSRQPGTEKYITAIAEDEIPRMFPVLSRYLSGSAITNTLDAAKGSRLAVGASSKLMKEVLEAVDAINPVTYPGGPGLKRKQKKIFNELMLEIQQRDKWLTGDQVAAWYLRNHGRSPSEREIRAYAATRLIYAFDYMGHNAKMRQEITSVGYQEGIVRGLFKSPTILKEVQTTSLPTNQVSIFDTRTGKFVHPRDKAELTKLLDAGSNIPLPRKEGALVEGRGVVLLKLLKHSKKYGDYIIAGKADVNIRPLRPRVLNISEGPHRIYDVGVSGRFIKQQRIRTVRGQVTIMHPKTHFAVQSGKTARKWADDYNAALEAWKIAKASGSVFDKAAATEIINTNTIFSSFEDMGKAIEEGRMETTPFEAVRDGELPKFGADTIKGLARDPDFANLSDQTVIAIQSGRLFFSRKGPHLLDGHPDGRRGAIIDADAVLSRAVNNVVDTLSYGPFRVRQTTRWVRTYGKYLVTDEGASIADQFFYGKIDTSPRAKVPISDKVLREAETQRDSILRLLRTSGTLEESVNRYRNMIIDLIDEKLNWKIADRFASVTSGNPVASARGAVFKAFLGFLGPSQSIVQRSTMPFVMMAFPVHGSRAMDVNSVIKASLLNPQHTKTLVEAFNSIVEVGGGKATVDSPTLIRLIGDLKRSGFANIDRNLGQLDTMADVSTILTMGGAFTRRLTDAGMLFFVEAEEWMRTIGFTIAWLEHFEKTGHGLITPDDFATVLVKANAIAGNMTRAEKAWWQQGLLGLPFQFLGQPARITEIMFMAQKGGLTKAQRWRAYMGLALAFGPLLGFQGDSTPTGSLAEYIKQRYFEATGSELDTNLLIRFLTEGVVGMMMPETDLARLKPYGQEFFLMKIFDTDDGLDIWNLLGATGTMGERFYDATIGSAKLWALLSANIDVDLIPITLADIAEDVMSTLVSYNRKEKAIMAWQTGRYISSNGRILQEDIDRFDILMISLGFPPRRSTLAFAGSIFIRQYKSKVIKDARQVARFIVLAVQAEKGSMEQRKNLAYAKYLLNLHHISDLDGDGGRLIAVEVDKVLQKVGNVYTTDVFILFNQILRRMPTNLLKNKGDGS